MVFSFRLVRRVFVVVHYIGTMHHVANTKGALAHITGT